MSSRAPTVVVVAEGPTSATTRLWRFRGQLRVTVILKATFSLVHQGMMKLGPRAQILTEDVHHGNSPVRSVRFTNDLAPYLPQTDVLLTGHAYAPAGEPAAWVTAGVGILDGYEPILEKYLDVRGDLGPDGGIQPFQKMPLVYERAYGGPGWEDNPFGVGAGGTRGEPNVFYIGDRKRSAGFAPFSAHWPARKRLVTAEVRKALSLPIAEIPEGFDWSYFQAAPKDQRCPFLSGSEWIVLQGLRPDERRVRTRLPAVKGRALVFWAGEHPAEEPLELIADTLRIEPDKGVCSVTWRKSFAVAEEGDLADLRVLAGVELGGVPIPWSLPGRPGVAAKSATDAETADEQPTRKEKAKQKTQPRPRAVTVELSDADLEVVRDGEDSGVANVEVAKAGAPEESAQARAFSGTVELVDRESLPGRVTVDGGPPLPAAMTPNGGVAPAGGLLGMGPLGVRPPAGTGQRPMILGSFRLAVFSPDYEEAPDDPLLSTLVIRNKPVPGPVIHEKGRGGGPAGVVASGAVGDDAESDDEVDDLSKTLELRARHVGARDGAGVPRFVGDLMAPPESTTGVLGDRPAMIASVPKAGPAGTVVIDDEDTEDTGPPLSDLE